MKSQKVCHAMWESKHRAGGSHLPRQEGEADIRNNRYSKVL